MKNLLIIVSLSLFFTSCKKDLTPQYHIAGVAYGSFLDGYYFPPDDSRINYVGRWSDAKAWNAGAYFNTRFNGTLVKIIINDERGSNHVTVVLDGQATRYDLHAGQNVISFTGLSSYFHTLLVCKANEASLGSIELIGIICQGLQPFETPSGRLIEFIGDSQTSGSGMIGPCSIPWADQQDAYNAFGPVTARSLNAEWILSSVSGIGLTHSYNNGYTMPAVYDKIDMADNLYPWSFRVTPDVVVVTLGQNDGVLNIAGVTAAYHSFLNTLRTKYPASEIIILNSPMGSWVDNIARSSMLQAIVDTRNDPRLSTYTFHNEYWHGCAGHPSSFEDQEIAGELGAVIAGRMNW